MGTAMADVAKKSAAVAEWVRCRDMVFAFLKDKDVSRPALARSLEGIKAGGSRGRKGAVILIELFMVPVGIVTQLVVAAQAMKFAGAEQ